MARQAMAPDQVEHWRMLLEAGQAQVRAARQRQQVPMWQVLTTTGVADSADARAGEGLAVPAALDAESNIKDYVQLAQELQEDDSTVAGIVVRAAIKKARALDPDLQKRGVLQFVTGLQGFADLRNVPEVGQRTDEEARSELEALQGCTMKYFEKLRKLEQDPDASRMEVGRYGTAVKVLWDVYKDLEQVTPAHLFAPSASQAEAEGAHPPARVESDVRATVEQLEEVRRQTFNIVNVEFPLDDSDSTQWRRHEARVQQHLREQMLQSLKGAERERFGAEFRDVLDLLGFIFCFQRDNVRNQREHLFLLLSNHRAPSIPDDQFAPRAVDTVCNKVLENYLRWVDYLHQDTGHLQPELRLHHCALFLLIWGEAANVRFMPECLCFLFHQMARELQSILGQGVRRSQATPLGGACAFLENVITPLYRTIKEEVEEAFPAGSKPKGHAAWRNYDDLNEFFWSASNCRELGWPLDLQHSFFVSREGKSGGAPQDGQAQGKRRKWLGKTNFVEWRSFFHVYRSFDRLWMFLLLMLQAMLILGFSDPSSLFTLIKVLSIFPAAAGYQFLEAALDLLLSIGCFRSLSGSMWTTKLARLTASAAWGASLAFFCIKVFQAQMNPSSPYFPVYLILLAAYVLPRLIGNVVLTVAPYRKWAGSVGTNKCVQFIKVFFRDQVYVGRGLYESTFDTFWYTAFWLLLLLAKFLFSYYMQILPMVGPTRFVSSFTHLQYKWKDLVSSSNYNAMTLVCLWAPVITIYILDLQIWYTVLSSIVGTAVGAWWRLGEIRSLSILRARFKRIPDEFSMKLQESSFEHKRIESMPRTRRAPDAPPAVVAATVAAARAPSFRTGTRRFALAWNEIIMLLRDEDYLSNKERDLLMMPPGNQRLTVPQWPLFLLANKVPLAVQAAAANKESAAALWRRISVDEYQAHAVREAYETVRWLLFDVLDTEMAASFYRRNGKVCPERRFLELIFGELDESMSQGEMASTFNLACLPQILAQISKLTSLLSEDPKEDGIKQVQAEQALQGLYDAVFRDLFANTELRARIKNSVEIPPGYKIFSGPRWPTSLAQAKRLHLLLTLTESSGEVPKNIEARRRLEFFTNSLFMTMPKAPLVSQCIPFCVMTPYYSETVSYSMKQLAKPNEDGISDLYYLQKIFPDEWANLLERVGLSEKEMGLKLKSGEDIEQLRMWASYRGQTLARTVRGMMYYHRALRLLSFMETGNAADVEMGADGRTLDLVADAPRAYLEKEEHKDLADRKFTYVVTCQIYGEQKAKGDERAEQIKRLMSENEALRIAYINVEEQEGGGKVYSSCLAKVDAYGQEQNIFKIQLPGPAKLGEGKPENQNHAVVFTRGEALQTIDMNQDNYFEEALKMRNLLQELNTVHGLRKPTILGVREHIFTGGVSSLAGFMSNQEASFVTLGQRVLAIPLKVRMHYGHPDVFDRVFHITRGGVSKASRTINISEDIFAGFNTTLRQGNVTHHEYIQVGKGRDVGLNQIALFEGKVAGGNGEQVLSRDIYRLGRGFDFMRMLSFYFTSVGFYICTLLTVWAAFFFLYGRVYLALSGVEATLIASAGAADNAALINAINTQFIIQLGFFSALPMLLGFILEQGVLKALLNFIVMQLQLASVFFTFSLGTRAHYFVRTLLHGGAKYRATGRGFVVKHIKFADNYRLYSRSHFTLGLEAIMLLIVYMVYGPGSNSTLYILITVSSWFLAISWCFAPFIFNPAGFDWQKTVADFDDWTAWLWYSGGVGLKSDQSWESWWDEESEHIHTLRSRMFQFVLNLRFFLISYGMVYWMDITNGNTSILVYGIYWIAVAVTLVTFSVFNWSRGWEAQLAVRIVQLTVFVLVVLGLILGLTLTKLSVSDIFVFILAFIPTGWGLLQVALAFRPTKDTKQRWWGQVRHFARLYDAAMGALLFLPVAILSWFPFTSTFQTRLMFNQAFSRGLEISLLLEAKPAGNA